MTWWGGKIQGKVRFQRKGGKNGKKRTVIGNKALGCRKGKRGKNFEKA